MKSRFPMSVIPVVVLVVFAMSVRMTAQEQQAQNAAPRRYKAQNAKHLRYKLIDLGTFRGPNSIFVGDPSGENVSNRGVAAAQADTDLPDPYAPNCFFDCYISHAFKWANGVVTDLGTLPPGGFSSAGYWINERGLIMGQSQNGSIDPITGLPEQVAVLWQENAEIVDLGTLGGSFSFANAMNNGGQVVGIALNGIPDPFSFIDFGLFGVSDGTQTRAFRWQDGMMLDLGTLGGPDSWASAINESGQIVGQAYTNSTPNSDNGETCLPNVPTQDPFLREKDGRMLDLGTLGGTCGVVGSVSNGGSGGAINRRGQVIGTSNLKGNETHHAFLWNEGVLMDLGTLGGDNSEAFWMNDAGEIVGRADFSPESTNHHAFFWKDGVMTDLGTLGPCLNSTAYAVNSRGQAVGDTGDCPGGSGGPSFFSARGQPMVDINTLVLPGSDIEVVDANVINERGEIAGNGILPNGDVHAVLLIPATADEIAAANAINVSRPTSLAHALIKNSETSASGGRTRALNMFRHMRQMP